jgi:hypothetical protein
MTIEFPHINDHAQADATMLFGFSSGFIGMAFGAGLHRRRREMGRHRRADSGQGRNPRDFQK